MRLGASVPKIGTHPASSWQTCGPHLISVWSTLSLRQTVVILISKVNEESAHRLENQCKGTTKGKYNQNHSN